MGNEEFQKEAVKMFGSRVKTRINYKASKWRFECWIEPDGLGGYEYTIHKGRTPEEALNECLHDGR